MKYLYSLILLSLLLPQGTWATTELNIDIIGIDYPSEQTVQIDLTIRDPDTGQDILLNAESIVVLENEQIVNREIMLIETSIETPTHRFGNSELKQQGAVIGLVVDMSTAANIAGDPIDYPNYQRELAEIWLEQGRNIISEHIGLFIPPSYASEESIQLQGLEGFSTDRNNIIQALRTAPERHGATQLNATIQAALQATAEQARSVGAHGYVVVFSDGADSSFTKGNLPWSNDVSLLIFAIGAPTVVAQYAELLETIATHTNGIYLAHPQPADIISSYEKLITTRQRRGYRITFQSQSFALQTQTSIKVQISGGEYQAESESIAIEQASLAYQPLSGGNSLQVRYAIQATIALLAASLIITLLTQHWQTLANKRTHTHNRG